MNNRDQDIIVIKDLYKHFGDVKALDGISLWIKRGSVVIIIGPSGSGKSTLLRCINYLEEPTQGEIWVDGELLTTDQKQLMTIRAEIGMVFQLFNLFPHLTSLENVSLAQTVVLKRSREEATKIAMDQLTRVGIPEKADVFPSKLSGGQQQRVAIARALAIGSSSWMKGLLLNILPHMTCLATRKKNAQNFSCRRSWNIRFSNTPFCHQYFIDAGHRLRIASDPSTMLRIGHSAPLLGN